MSIIKVSVNVDKIDKNRLFQGQKGRWLNLVLIPTPDSEYGDYMVKQDISYEDRMNGVQSEILGNAKIKTPQAGGMQVRDEPQETPDLPF